MEIARPLKHVEVGELNIFVVALASRIRSFVVIGIAAAFTGFDNCGISRTVNCGDCAGPQTCGACECLRSAPSP